MHLQDKSFAIKTMTLGASLKIFVNYSQTIAIIHSLHLNWDEKLSDMFNLHKTISSGVQQVIGLECLLEGWILVLFSINFFCIDLNLVPYIKILLVICCPVGFCGLLMFFWIAYKIYKKSEFSIILECFLITSTITFFYFQIPVINELAGMLNCYPIENESYITDYPLEPCTNNSRYSDWTNILVIPAACFFVLILPVWPIYYMHKNKNRIFSKEVIQKVGFLLNGYSPQSFYW